VRVKWFIRLGIRVEAGLSKGRAEDAGGLTPVVSDNVALRKSSPGTALISGRIDN